jgi:nucleoid DNA-binding protein
MDSREKGTLSIKNYLVKRTASKLNVDESIVDLIVGYQFTEILQAVHNYNSIEVSGLFTLSVSKKRALNRRARFEKFKEKVEEEIKQCTDPKKLLSLQRTLENTINGIEQLNSKILKFDED